MILGGGPCSQSVRRRHWKVLLSSSRRKSTWHPKHVRSCGEAGDFNDVTLAWKDGLLLTLKSESVDDSKQPVFWKWRTSRRCQRLAANPENGVWWRQICWKMICFRAEAWMCHNHCGRKYSGFRAYAAKLLKLMPCDYTGNSVLGVVWSVATPSGNSFTYLHFIGSFYTVCFMSINCILSLCFYLRKFFATSYPWQVDRVFVSINNLWEPVQFEPQHTETTLWNQ